MRNVPFLNLILQFELTHLKLNQMRKFEKLFDQKFLELSLENMKQIKGGGGDPPPWKKKKKK